MALGTEVSLFLEQAAINVQKTRYLKLRISSCKIRKNARKNIVFEF
jgi:hypothetical protein